MAHLILQLGAVPLIPFPGRRFNVSQRLRARALWEAATASRRNPAEPPLIDPRLLPMHPNARGLRKARRRAPGGDR